MAEPLRVVIIGAGDHGRGTLEIFKACNQQHRRFDNIGFLDDARQGGQVDGLPVLGGIDWAESDSHRGGINYIIAVADGRTKRALIARLEPRRLTYARVIHPSATVAPDSEIGDGSIISAGVVIAYSTRIGKHVTVNLNATVGHDCDVGAFATIAPGANIAGRVTIGEGCNVGLNSTIVRGISLGPWSMVGPGAVVLKDTLPDSRVFGNPARALPAQS